VRWTWSVVDPMWPGNELIAAADETAQEQFRIEES
jgi:hypothetical protein